MALFGIICISSPPGVMVELIGDHSLPAVADVDVLDGLFARLVELGQRLEGSAGIGLGLQRQPATALGRVDFPPVLSAGPLSGD